MSSQGRHQRLPQNDPDSDAPQSRFHTIHDTPANNSGGNAGSYSGGMADGGVGGGGNPVSSCCTNCCNYLPLFCRILILLIFAGMIANFFATVHAAVALYAYSITSNFVNIYRVFVCTYFGFIVGSLFSILHIFQDTSLLEHKKGTIYFIHLWFTVSLAVNISYFLLMWLFSTVDADAALWDSQGPWPTLLALLPLQLKLDPREEYNFCFCKVPAKYYPWAVCALLSAMSAASLVWKGIPSMVLGLLYGYILARYENQLTLSMITLRRWENGSLSFLVHQTGFVSCDAWAGGGGPQPWSLQNMIQGGMAQPPAQAGRTYGSGTTGGTSGGGSQYYGMPPDEVNPDTMMEEKEAENTQPSVFASGTGHRLGGNNSSSTSTVGSSSTNRLTSFFARSQASPTPTTTAAQPTSADAARQARIPMKGLNRLVENAYKQKAPGSDIELPQRPDSTSSSTAAGGASSLSVNELSSISTNMSAVDNSPLLAGMTSSDEIPVLNNNNEREKNILRLGALGFSREDARNALIIADDDFDAAHRFLTTPLTSSI